jgi:hypothetical protein
MVRTQTDRLLQENMKLQKKLQQAEKQIKRKLVRISNTNKASKEKEVSELTQLKDEIVTHTIMKRDTSTSKRKSIRQSVRYSALGMGVVKAKQATPNESVVGIVSTILSLAHRFSISLVSYCCFIKIE